MVALNSWIWHILENYVYAIKEPPPQKRTVPMEVICVGPPRSGTESTQKALLMLGYDHTHHGWDVLFDGRNSQPGWVRLARRKWWGGRGFEERTSPAITRQEFDVQLGHCRAVTDQAGSVFAAEVIAAYPEARVVLNLRRDQEAWHRSAVGAFGAKKYALGLWVLSWFDAELFWCWHVYGRVIWPIWFRTTCGEMDFTLKRNGKSVYKEHCDMIRGLVPKERLLEWDVKDGWEPLCKFLGKPVPEEALPHVNAGSGAFQKTMEKVFTRMAIRAVLRLVATVVVTSAGAGYLFYNW